MRKRQKSRRKKGNGNRQIDQRDREWLTRGERFEEKNARQICTKRRQEKLDSTDKVIDVSLHEYADNPQAPASGRISKAKGGTVVLHKEVVMEKTGGTTEDEVADDWFLNEDSDLEYLESENDAQDETSLVEDSPRVKDKGIEDNVQDYIQYPPDIWYLISSYISPLQVGCFAAICRDAYNVTTTAAFWKSLYQRFKSPDAKLPVELQPFSMSRTYGIRALVIRALHIMYEPYVKRIKALPSIAEGMDAPSSLASSTCLYMWSRGQVGCHYYHFFKFQGDDAPPLQNTNYFNEDVYFNPHKNECILKVFCQSFQHFPTEKVMGSRLVNVSISVSGNFRYHRLKLQFTKGQLRGRPRDSDLLTVVLDPVIVIRVLHWWHPQFQECLNQGSTFGTAHTVAAASAVWEGRI